MTGSESFRIFLFSVVLSEILLWIDSEQGVKVLLVVLKFLNYMGE